MSSPGDNLPNATFNVYRSTASGQEQQSPPISGGVSIPSFEDTTGVGGTAYFYEVTEVDNGIEGPPSNEASATFPTIPAAPTGLTATAE